jgi:hypothetical protein
MPVQGSRAPSQDWQHTGLQSTRDVNIPATVDKDIHLAPDPELIEINPWLDGETRLAQDRTFFVGLEVVHVGAVAVNFLADVMPNTVNEVVAIPGIIDHAAARGVNLPRLQGTSCGVRIADAPNRRVAGGGHDGEDLLEPLRHLLSDESHASQVAVNSPRPIKLGPEVNQHKITGAD